MNPAVSFPFRGDGRRLPARPLISLSIFIVGMVVLLPPIPAHALEARTFGDVVVRPMQNEDEVSTVFGDVLVNGAVSGDVKSGSGDVEINGPVGGVVSSGWGDIRTQEMVGGVEADFGDVYIGAPVEGDVEVEHGDVTLGPGAMVRGDLKHGSGQFIGNRAAVRGAVVNGMATDFDGSAAGSKLLGFAGWTLAALGFAACSLLVAVLMPGTVLAASQRLEDSPGWSLLLGVASVPVVVVSFVLLAISVAGIPLLLLLAPAYLAGLFFGALVAAFFIGRRVVFATGRYRAGNALAAVVGALIVAAVYQIPFVGNLLLYLAALAGAGAAILALASRRRPPAHTTYETYIQEQREV